MNLPSGTRLGAYSASQTGVLALGVVSQATRISWFDRSGREGATLALRSHCRNPELSPDFSRVAIDCFAASGNRDIWLRARPGGA